MFKTKSINWNQNMEKIKINKKKEFISKDTFDAVEISTVIQILSEKARKFYAYTGLYDQEGLQKINEKILELADKLEKEKVRLEKEFETTTMEEYKWHLKAAITRISLQLETLYKLYEKNTFYIAMNQKRRYSSNIFIHLIVKIEILMYNLFWLKL